MKPTKKYWPPPPPAAAWVMQTTTATAPASIVGITMRLLRRVRQCLAATVPAVAIDDARTVLPSLTAAHGAVADARFDACAFTRACTEAVGAHAAWRVGEVVALATAEPAAMAVGDPAHKSH